MNSKKRTLLIIIIVLGVFSLFSLTNGSNSGGGQPYPSQPEVIIDGGNLDVLKPIDEEAIEDSEYYSTIEEALLYYGNKRVSADRYRYNISEEIFKMENEDYATIYYRSVKDENAECFTIAKLKKKKFEDGVKYTFLTCSYSEMEANAWIIGSFEEIVESKLEALDYMGNLGSDAQKRFVYGDTKDKKVFKLKIEGQEPSGIIPYESFGEQWYFWYYEDLESDKPGSQLEFTVE